MYLAIIQQNRPSFLGYIYLDIVDEFQDTNSIQYALLRLLTGVKSTLFAVGDEDQSIYRWRGAKVEHIAQFQKDFPATKIMYF